MTTDYLELVFDEFVELHGDKFFGDDRAIRTGFAKLDRYKVMVVGHQKGKTLKERNACYFGLRPSRRLSQGDGQDEAGGQVPPAGDLPHRHAGAYPGIGAEERGQAQVIAESMFEMSRLPTPIDLRGDRRRRAPAAHWASAWATAWPCWSTPIIR